MKTVYSYIYDFLSIVFEIKDTTIRNIILFGSVSRGDFDKVSDIDLFFDTQDEINLENDLKKALKTFEVKKLKTWKLKGIDLPIKFIAGNLDDERWSALKQDIISTGVSLYGKFEALPQNIEHFALMIFSLEKLERKDKMRFIREMFGYKNIKSNKEYVHSGYLEKVNGKRLGTNTILVPLSELNQLKKIFRSYKLVPRIMEVWTR